MRVALSRFAIFTGALLGITTGRVDGAIAVAHCVAQSLVGNSPRIEASRATDQPEVSVYARIDDVWRATTVIGLHAGDEITAPDPEVTVPRAFLDIRNTSPHRPRRWCPTRGGSGVRAHIRCKAMRVHRCMRWRMRAAAIR